MDKWMMLELETIYGQKRYAIYDSSKFRGNDGEEELKGCIDLSDMYINQALDGEDCKCMVLDEPTYRFWSKMIKEAKEQVNTKGFIEGMKFVGNGE
jgi:hypothetical protein